jgi:hypothetical protein
MKKIAGYDSYYITDDGKVWSSKTKRFLKLRPNAYGRLRVSLSKKSKVRDYYVSRLVWEYYGDTPLEDGDHVHHKNEDYTDNRIENLERMNIVDHNRMHTSEREQSGEDNHMSRVSEKTIRTICKLLEEKKTAKEISEVVNESQDYIRRIKRHERWSHVSKDYNF